MSDSVPLSYERYLYLIIRAKILINKLKIQTNEHVLCKGCQKQYKEFEQEFKDD